MALNQEVHNLRVPTIGNADFDHLVKVVTALSLNINTTFSCLESEKIRRSDTLSPLDTLFPQIFHITILAFIDNSCQN